MHDNLYSPARNTLDRIRKFFSYKEICLQELRHRWGRHLDRYRNRTEIATLHVLTSSDKGSRTVDDSSWNDLDMDALFDRLDNTTTAIGQQYLYRQLRTYELDEDKLHSQYRVAEHFLLNSNLREHVQLNMFRLRSPNASVITTMLFDELPQGDFPHLLAWCLACISLLAIGVAVLIPTMFWLPIVAVIGNFIYSETYSHRIGRHSMSFVYLKSLLIVACRLSKLPPTPAIKQLEYLRKRRKNIRRLRAEFRIVGFDSTDANPFVAQAAYFLNLICLFDFLIFMRSSKRLAKHQKTLSEIYTAVASMDSAISVGSYMAATSHHCCPDFADGREMHFDCVTHPLLDNAVPNSYSSTGDSALVTGSNMAGKSTFIKTVGTNLILAQTFWMCHARSAQIPKVSVMTSIKRSDSLEEGKSYYFAEIEALRRLIEAKDSNQPHIFLIDEILHGTNTVERIASAAAILDYLSHNNTVMVTSHDVELEQLLPPCYKSFHFQETPDLDNMFDYKLRDGHCTTRNAIKLLELIGFPPAIIDSARSIAEKQNLGSAQ